MDIQWAMEQCIRLRTQVLNSNNNALIVLVGMYNIEASTDYAVAIDEKSIQDFCNDYDVVHFACSKQAYYNELKVVAQTIHRLCTRLGYYRNVKNETMKKEQYDEAVTKALNDSSSYCTIS